MDNTGSMKDNCNHSMLATRIESAKRALHTKLHGVDLSSSAISPYIQRYIKRQARNFQSVFDRYGKILQMALENNAHLLDRIVLVDYGGGSGLLSLLAKEVGVGTVVYNDIYDVSCNDLKILSALLRITIDEIVCGDIEVLIDFVRREAITIDTIVSNDVIEHIYDVEKHFKTLSSISDGDFTVVYSTNAILSNPVYVYLVRKSQIAVETKNREKKWGDKERDTQKAYLEVRKSIISAYAPHLCNKDVAFLSRRTRGLIKTDIERCVDQYLLEGRIDYAPDHPTNTCDPYTGNWCEHLMDLGWLKAIVESAGFSATIYSGQYAVSGPPLKKIAKLLLNCIIRVLGIRGLFAAPYFILRAERKQTDY